MHSQLESLNEPQVHVYVCNCNAIRERDARHAIQCGASTPKAVFTHCQAKAQCAKCVCEIRQLIEEQAAAMAVAAE